MRNIYLFIFLPFVTLFFTSCEEIIEPDISNFKAKLVMSSNFSPDKALEVTVSETRPITAPRTPLYVTNAVVEVYQVDKLIEQLELFYPPEINGQNFPPKYISQNFIAEVDVAYTIKVRAVGFDDIEATSTVPSQTEIESINFENNTITEAAFSTVDFQIQMSFQDDESKGNFYQILLSQKLCEYEITTTEENGNLIQDTVIYERGIPAELTFEIINNNFESIKYLDGQSILLSDRTFAGMAPIFNIQGTFTYNAEKYIPGNFSVEIRNLSPEYYYYYKSLTEQFNTGSDDLTDPGVIIDNVNNGNGIFAGYNPTISTFSLGGN